MHAAGPLSMILIIGVSLLALFSFVGSGWATMITEGPFLCAGWGLIIGFSINIVIVCLANFLGFPASSDWLPTLFIIILVGFIGWGLGLKYGGGSHTGTACNIAALLLVLAIYLIFSSPLYLKYKQVGSIFYYSGDYMTYWSHAHWFANHSIKQKPDARDLISPMAIYFYDYQTKGLRIAPQMYIAFLDSMFGMEPDQLLTLFSGFVLGLQGLMAALLMLSLNSSRLWVAWVVGLLFGTHPFLIWDGYASFYPQIIGFIFAMTILAVVSLDKFWGNPLRAGMLMGLMTAALLISYIEIMPFLGIISLGISGAHLYRKRDWKNFCYLALGFGITFGTLSIIDFSHFWHGLMYQIKTKGAYGGEQTTNLLPLLGLWLGVIRAPLEPAMVEQLTWLHFEIILVAIATAIGAFFVGWKNLRELRWTVFFCFLMLAATFFYTFHEYQGVVLSWNIFKLINYSVPLLYLWMLLAMFSRPFFGIIFIYLITLGVGQATLWKSVYRDSQIISSHFPNSEKQREAEERRLFIRNLPSNAQFYVGSLPSYKARFHIYSLLNGRHFLTIYDNFDLNRIFSKEPNKALMLEPAANLSQEQLPIRYVLSTLADLRLYDGKIIYHDTDYAILELSRGGVFSVCQQYSDGKNEIFVISRDLQEKKIPVIFLSSQPQTIEITLIFNELNHSKIHRTELALNAPITRYEIDCSQIKESNFQMTLKHQGLIEVLNDHFSKEFKHFTEEPVNLTQWLQMPNPLCKIKADITSHSVTFTAAEPSSGWLLFNAKMSAGFYYYEIKTGAIELGEVTSVASRPFFFGATNDNYHTLRLIHEDAHATRWFPFLVGAAQLKSFYTGMGAWGTVMGKGEINSLKLFKEE